LTLRNEGGAGMVAGSWRTAEAIAEFTSWAAASDVAAERELQRDAGGALAAHRAHLVDAGDGGELLLKRSGDRRGHVSGLAPGSSGADLDGGKSTLGSVDTGSSRYAAMPKIRMPAMTRTVMTGRRIQISQKFTKARPESC